MVLMTYGAPRDSADVPAYLARVRGREPTPELAAEMTRRYRLIGGSPLVRITIAQARALERELGVDYVVRAAMRFSEPSIDRVVAELAPAVDEVVGVVLSPQWSDRLMAGYERALRDAAMRAAPATRVHMVREWHAEPRFIDCLASALRSELARTDRAAVLLTAHSLPRRVYDAEPGYVEQLRATAELVARAAGLGDGEWAFAYQSAGHTQEEWLRPDLVDLFGDIFMSGHRDVLVAPVQFLADHLEVLYDLDVAARAQAEAVGLRYHRVPMPNDSPAFARALASLVAREAIGAR